MKSVLYFLFIVLTAQLSAQSFTALPSLPYEVSNNAVTHGVINGRNAIFSFCGIDASKEPSGIHLETYYYDPEGENWFILFPIDDPNGGKIAASASTVKNKIYIIGGYHVAENFLEVSSNKVHIFDPEELSFEEDGANIPVPIDDQVQVVWRDSLIYVVTGWSNDTNVTDVQIYNPELNTWSAGTPVPADGNYNVFGASGTIIGDTIYYIGGARIAGSFPISNFMRKGVINPDNPTEITWSGNFNGGAIAYRPASFTYEGDAYWLGGSEQTYNFDGLAYSNGQAVPPFKKLLKYNPSWELTEMETTLGQVPPVMDLRGIAKFSDTEFAIAGGMKIGPEVTDEAWLINMAAIVSTENEETTSFQVYPNPVGQILTIQYKGFFEMELSNIFGQKILSKDAFQTTTIDVAGLTSGMYVLSIKKNGAILYAEKVEIQH